MSKLQAGIVGLPNVGKSTLFSALTRKQVAAENYPFCTIEPNVGVVEVPDPRVDMLGQLAESQRKVFATCEFVDIAGLVEGAAKGEGLGNQFLTHIRQVDLIVHTVRCFEDPNIIHVSGKVDPIHDIEVIELELILADLQVVEQAALRLEKGAKGHKEKMQVVDLLKKMQSHLEKGLPARTFPLSDEDRAHFHSFSLLTFKPVLYVGNMEEEDYIKGGNAHFDKVAAYAKQVGSEAIMICAKLEAELASFTPDAAAEYLCSLGIKEPGLNCLIRAAYSRLGLISFFTVGDKETRAWTVPIHSTAPIAAGKIHSDIEKGFIRAEVISYDDYVKYKTRHAAKLEGKARLEGKEYIVQDGDVILFFHN